MANVIDNTVKLRNIIESVRRERRARAALWRDFRNELVGGYWREGWGVHRVTNFAHAYASTMLSSFVGNHPDIIVKPNSNAPEVLATVGKQALNNRVAKAGLVKTVRRIVLDSLYAVGVGKTTLIPNPDDPTRLVPTVVAVSPFRFLWDDTADNLESVRFVGDELWVDPDDLTELSQLEIESALRFKDIVESSDSASQTDPNLIEAMPDLIRVIEIYDTRAKMLARYVEQRGGDLVPLGEPVPYMGRQRHLGPYHILGYLWVRQSAMPVAPAHGWWGERMNLEEQERKLLKQIANEFTIVAFPSSGKKAAEIIQEAENYSIVTGVDVIGRQVTWGGVTDQGLIAVADARSRLEFASGLSDTRRGVPSRTTETASATVARDSASQLQVFDRQVTIEQFTSEVVTDWWYYMMHADGVAESGVLVDEATGLKFPFTLLGGPQQSDQIRYSDYTVSVREGSMRGPVSLIERAHATEELSILLGPVATIAATQGLMVDVKQVIKEYGRRIGRPDMDSMLVPITPEAAQLQLALSQSRPGPGATRSLETVQRSSEGELRGQPQQVLASRSPVSRSASVSGNAVRDATSPTAP